jgi:hypothetical protein
LLSLLNCFHSRRSCVPNRQVRSGWTPRFSTITLGDTITTCGNWIAAWVGATAAPCLNPLWLDLAWNPRKSMEGCEQKITLGSMRAAGVRGLLVYCSDHRCSHHIAISAEPWLDEVRLSDLQPRFVCTSCGRRGADVTPNFTPARMEFAGAKTASKAIQLGIVYVVFTMEDFVMIRILAFVALMGGVILSEQIQAAPACYNAQKCDADCQKSGNVGKSCKKMCDHQQATLPACK